MKKYLLDTNICIYYLNGNKKVKEKLLSIEILNRFISEISLAELKYGVENSNYKEKKRESLNDFLTGIQILPIYNCLDLYASEKSRLRKLGIIVDDFDLLIGTSASANQMILVTNNIKHFINISEIRIENWLDN